MVSGGGDDDVSWRWDDDDSLCRVLFDKAMASWFWFRFWVWGCSCCSLVDDNWMAAMCSVAREILGGVWKKRKYWMADRSIR